MKTLINISNIENMNNMSNIVKTFGKLQYLWLQHCPKSLYKLIYQIDVESFRLLLERKKKERKAKNEKESC